jgi:hypothetical protein
VKLPNGENAYISPSKLTGYLLSETHSVGKAKAGFFRVVGFDEAQVEMLERGLLAIARSEEVQEVITSLHGTKYVVEGALETPTGRSVQVRTVWIVELDQNRPRFVTAYTA